MNRILITILLLLFLHENTMAQEFNPTVNTDTIHLKSITLKKVLAFKINSVTILVDYNDFMRSFTPFWKKFQKGVRSLNRGKEKAIDENPYYLKRFIFLDSTYKRLTREIKTADTVHIDQLSFQYTDIGTGYDFIQKIEEGDCIILDKDNIRQSIILKQKHSYQKDLQIGWGGRLYFIDKQKWPFIKRTDWIS